MLSLTASSRIFLAIGAVDFRKGIDGMIGLCKSQLSQDPRSGAVFAFINRDKTRIKLLVFDGSGYWLCMKRLSEGRFVNWPTGEDKIANVDAKKLLVLLMGPKPAAPGVSGEWKKVS